MRLTRRQLLSGSLSTLGTAALSTLLSSRSGAAAGRAKRVIWLFQSGGPSQLETFDYKPGLAALEGTELPESVRMGQRLTTMTSMQSTLAVLPSRYTFAQHGQSGAWVSEILPATAEIADRLCFVRSMYTEAINHEPAVAMLLTGHQLPGRPSIGSWLSYGLGGITSELPAFVVLVSKNRSPDAQPLYSRMWSSGFLPPTHQGVQLRAAKDPVLFLRDPVGTSSTSMSRLRDAIGALDREHLRATGDEAIDARIRGYELAFDMQMSVPEVTDLSDEPESTFALYGEDARTPGTHAANCLLARRLAERGVRFIQLFHRDWDHHSYLHDRVRRVAGEQDRGSAALVRDLEQRGLLEDTIVIWGGEFGRTVYSQGDFRSSSWGRDHHPRCFTMWLAGGGFKPGITYGETDELSYNVARDGVHVHDLQATVLHQLGIDHRTLTYRYQGRQFRLTDVGGRVVDGLLA